MHFQSTLNLLLALSASVLATPNNPSTQNLPSHLSQRGIIPANISTYAAADCTGDPLNPTFQVVTADPKHSPCLPFGANPNAHIGVHWGTKPKTTGTILYYGNNDRGDDCTVSLHMVLNRGQDHEFDCYTLKSDGPAASAVFITW